MTSRGREDERSKAFLISVLNVRSAAEKEIDELLVSASTGEGEGGVVVAVRLAVQVHHGLLVTRSGVAGGQTGTRHVVAGVARRVEHPGRGLDTSSQLGGDCRLLLPRLLLVMRQQAGLADRLTACWEADVTQIWAVLKLDAVRGGVVKICPADSDITAGLEDRQSLAGPEGELRLEEKLMAKVGDGLRAVLGAVSEQRDTGGRQGGGDDPRTGQGRAVLESHAASSTGRNLTRELVLLRSAGWAEL